MCNNVYIFIIRQDEDGKKSVKENDEKHFKG